MEDISLSLLSNHIKAIIEGICTSQCITKTSLALQLGVSPTALSRWCSGKSFPRLKHFNHLIILLNTCNLFKDELC